MSLAASDSDEENTITGLGAEEAAWHGEGEGVVFADSLEVGLDGVVLAWCMAACSNNSNTTCNINDTKTNKNSDDNTNRTSSSSSSNNTNDE